MIDVELIYDADCPNAARTRAHLRAALERAGLPIHWSEWLRADPATPADRRRFASPTVLVNGVDVAGPAPLDGAGACRLYPGQGGAGVPAVDSIAVALAKASGGGGGRLPGEGLVSSLAAVPGIAAALLPALACPACWPAYAGALSALGLGALSSVRYLLPLNLVLLGVALAALGIGARRRRGYGPLLLGGAGTAGVLVAKFLLANDALVYSSAALLLAASVWNAWPRGAPRRHCASCTTPGDGKSSITNTYGGS